MLFRAAISRETKLIKGEKKQFPNVDTNLSDVGRSFADPIEYKGFTEEYNYRQQVWEEAHSELKQKPGCLLCFLASFSFDNFWWEYNSHS